MSPLEKLNAAAARLVSEAAGCRDRQMSIRLTETAATIRAAVASIRRALEEAAGPTGKKARERLILGDEVEVGK
jgi:hypothetical protein